jgi:hypothetical protein
MRRWFPIGVFLPAILIFYLACLHYTEVGRVGIMQNWKTGELKLDQPGWNISPPWVAVAKVDTRPMRVCVTSASRAFNCKLVEFVPSEFKIFVETEGFHYYWWYNRFSFNGGYDEEYRGVKDILRGYAYSIKEYPFVRVIRDYN